MATRKSAAKKPAAKKKRASRPARRPIPPWRTVWLQGAPESTSHCVGLTVAPQLQTQWCWAAVSDSIAHFYNPGSSWTQCTIANAEIGQTNCCTAAGSVFPCNQPWTLSTALTQVGHLQTVVSGTLTFAAVQNELNNGQPPCARQAWSTGGAHFMAIVCWYTGPGSAQRLMISDPWYGNSVVDYATFVRGYHGTGSWTHSYPTQP